jgi:LPS export ABC transporter protein LptC
MRRTRLRAALLLAVTSALIGIGYLTSRSLLERRPQTWADLGKDFLPQVAQRIQNFRRVKMENGRTVWEVTAKDAQYFEQDSQIVVVEPRMTFFLEGGRREAHVTGSEGRIMLDGRELRSLTLRGSVAVRLDDLELQTAEATYDRERDMITSPTLVTIRGKEIELTGRGMEVDVGPQHVRLLDDVHTTIRRDAAAS